MSVKQTQNVKCHGGYVKQIKHSSEVNNCEMTFSIFIPEKLDRLEAAPPVLYYLPSVTHSDDDPKTKGDIFQHAAKYGIAVVIPDTLARGDEVEAAKEDKDPMVATFYLNAKTL